MFKRLPLSRRSLLLSSISLLALNKDADAMFSMIQVGNQTQSGSFTSAWRSAQTSGGGQLAGMHTYADGTILTTGDTTGPWLYKRTGTVSYGGDPVNSTIYNTPAWQLLATADSLPAGDVSWTEASDLNTTAIEIVAAPSNTNVLYMWYSTKVYVSTNRGQTWTYTGLTVKYNHNQQDKNSDWMAVDPVNPDIVYIVTANGTYGPTDGSTGTVLKNVNGTTGTTWTVVSSVAPTTHKGGNIVFDPTAGSTGGVSNRILYQIQGSTGVWESTNGGSTWTQQNTGTPPTYSFKILVDKFGVVWLTAGWNDTTYGRIFKYTGGGAAWSLNTTLATNNYGLASIMQDPNAGATQANNQLIAVDGNGYIYATVNNGGSWSAMTNTNITMQSLAPQAGWLNTTQESNAGLIALNIGSVNIDPTTGTIYASTGIDCFTTPNPIVSGALQTSAVWSANTIGIDQLVVNKIISPFGAGPSFVCWDRGVFALNNPDSLASSQYPNKNSPTNTLITGAWGLDSVLGSAFQAALIYDTPSGVISLISKSADGGNTWANVNLPSVGISKGGVIATSSATNWVTNPGGGASQYNVLHYTTDGGTTWNASSVPANNGFQNQNFYQRRQPLAADKSPTNPGVFYAMDVGSAGSAPNFFKSTNNGATFTATALASSIALGNGTVGVDQLQAAPKLGSFDTAGHVYYTPQGGPIFKSTNGTGSFSVVNASLDRCINLGFGAPKPGGNGYPSMYVYQIAGGTAAQGMYQSNDGGSTWALIQTSASNQLYPAHIMDYPSWCSGDSNVYGRIYIGFLGQTMSYIDTQDAVPWVNWSNVKPTQALTGSVTLTAQRSGLVLITSVVFQVDGSTIATFSGAQSSYSTTWNASGIAAGSHTLTVIASNANGSGSFAIPITTS